MSYSDVRCQATMTDDFVLSFSSLLCSLFFCVFRSITLLTTDVIDNNDKDLRTNEIYQQPIPLLSGQSTSPRTPKTRQNS